ncbi:FASLG [Branchiostoma lanceolatum]|uniref:FASLG protein n=1 Tax=Branchiostoma lanceolatum TaxID=7740 RepID=A0A8J9Z269_BRALA|nr:FASLG [Branchiostoma lanceolatum]
MDSDVESNRSDFEGKGGGARCRCFLYTAVCVVLVTTVALSVASLVVTLHEQRYLQGGEDGASSGGSLQTVSPSGSGASKPCNSRDCLPWQLPAVGDVIERNTSFYLPVALLAGRTGLQSAAGGRIYDWQAGGGGASYLAHGMEYSPEEGSIVVPLSGYYNIYCQHSPEEGSLVVPLSGYYNIYCQYSLVVPFTGYYNIYCQVRFTLTPLGVATDTCSPEEGSLVVPLTGYYNIYCQVRFTLTPLGVATNTCSPEEGSLVVPLTGYYNIYCQVQFTDTPQEGVTETGSPHLSFSVYQLPRSPPAYRIMTGGGTVHTVLEGGAWAKTSYVEGVFRLQARDHLYVTVSDLVRVNPYEYATYFGAFLVSR